MARTLLTPVAVPGPTSVTPALLVFTAWDNANGNRFSTTGREVIIINNSHATLARTVTVISVADERGRTGDITAFSMAALTYYVLPYFVPTGWKQTDGTIYIDGSTIDIKFCVLTLP